MSDSVEVQIECPHHVHDPITIPRATICRESQRARDFLRSTQRNSIVLDLRIQDRKYGCETLTAILATWHSNGVYRRDLKVRELLNLARVLCDWKCRIHQSFGNYAMRVRNSHFESQFSESINSKYWAFIAVVFGWEDVFGQAVMDIPGLQHCTYMLPSPDDVDEVWPLPVEDNVLRYIITAEFHAEVRRITCDCFNHLQDQLLRQDQKHRQLADALVKHLEKQGFRIPPPPSQFQYSFGQNDTRGSSSGGSAHSVDGDPVQLTVNQRQQLEDSYFTNNSVISLHRCFQEFINPQRSATGRPTRGRRVSTVPFSFKGGREQRQSREARALSQAYDDWYRGLFPKLLRKSDVIRMRFEAVHNHGPIIEDGTETYELDIDRARASRVYPSQRPVIANWEGAMISSAQPPAPALAPASAPPNSYSPIRGNHQPAAWSPTQTRFDDYSGYDAPGRRSYSPSRSWEGGYRQNSSGTRGSYPPTPPYQHSGLEDPIDPLAHATANLLIEPSSPVAGPSNNQFPVTPSYAYSEEYLTSNGFSQAGSTYRSLEQASEFDYSYPATAYELPASPPPSKYKSKQPERYREESSNGVPGRGRRNGQSSRYAGE